MKQKLVTKEVAKVLEKFPLYSQEDKGEDALVAVKFFSPYTGWTWYVLEAEKREDDYLFFGYVQGIESEYGYFSLSELENFKTRLGVQLVERDAYMALGKRTLGSFINK